MVYFDTIVDWVSIPEQIVDILERVLFEHLTDAVGLSIAFNAHDTKNLFPPYYMRLAFLVREGCLCEKLGLPKDMDPEFRDLSDYMEILELYLEALPSFI